MKYTMKCEICDYFVRMSKKRLWIPSFERFLEGRKMTKVRLAIEKALRNMHPPFDGV